MKNGRIILITGFYGAGKTTLTQAAIEKIDRLEYLKTTTTRPPRTEEVEYGSLEYDFVSPEAYEARRAKSRHWDHTLLHDHSYGADVDAVTSKIVSGTDIICCIAPDEEIIAQMSALYDVQPIIIWIDTPLRVANQRLLESGSTHRLSRINHHLQSEVNAARTKLLASFIFEPTDSLVIDIGSFTQLARQILREK